MRCGGCGGNSEGRFCTWCGARLVVDGPERARKPVTVLVTDICDSTGLGIRLDPEVVERVLSRFASLFRQCVERHGGVVEKFIGDAGVAVFGIPVAHEDDSLRAIRAAFEFREGLVGLNEELNSLLGEVIEVRTGINSGTVVTGGADSDRLVVGQVMVTATRLQSAAQPGQIIIGTDIYSSLRGFLVSRPYLVTLPDGKMRPAAEAVEINPTRPASRDRLIGRHKETEVIVSAFNEVVRKNSPRLVTVVAPAGMGKSRLCAEVTRAVKDMATVVEGRCLPYGEGITFWPITEMMRQLVPDGAGNWVDQVLSMVASSEAVATNLGVLLSKTEGARSTLEETFSAIEYFFSSVAARRPLVMVFDDIHWAEPTLLDLIEYLTSSLSGSVLLLSESRPELLERQPQWASVLEGANVLHLSPLSRQDATELIAHTAGSDALDDSARDSVITTAEGNPLFLRELTAMVAGDLDQQYSMPHNIAALLSARLEQLPTNERMVLERASVIGREFWETSLRVLLEDSDVVTEVEDVLSSLQTKGLIETTTSEFSSSSAFRFHHILLRDAAYERLPKSTRADLHERFADWLAGLSGPANYDEILAYHYEQAAIYAETVTTPDPLLNQKAKSRLLLSADHALSVWDTKAFVRYFRRLIDREATNEEKARRVIELNSALGDCMEYGQVLRTVDEYSSLMEGVGGELSWQFQVQRADVLLQDAQSDSDLVEALRLASEAAEQLKMSRKDSGLPRAVGVAANCLFIQGHGKLSADMLDSVLASDDIAQTDRRRLVLDRLLSGLHGPEHLDVVRDKALRYKDLSEGSPGDLMLSLANLAYLESLANNHDAAQAYLEERESVGQVARSAMDLSGMKAALALIEIGQVDSGRTLLSRNAQQLLDSRNTSSFGTACAYLALLDAELGDYKSSRYWLEQAMRVFAPLDIVTFVYCRMAQVELDLHNGDKVAALSAAEESAERAAKSDYLLNVGDAQTKLAKAREAAGLDQAQQLAKAQSSYSKKGIKRPKLQASGGRVIVHHL